MKEMKRNERWCGREKASKHKSNERKKRKMSGMKRWERKGGLERKKIEEKQMKVEI